MNAHQATPEQLALAAEGDDLAREKGYIKLGIAVLLQAIQDATIDIPETTDPIYINAPGDVRSRWNVQRAARDEAQVFLTTENSDLAFWSWIAGIHASAVVHYAKRAKGRWEELGEALRASRLHMRKAS